MKTIDIYYTRCFIRRHLTRNVPEKWSELSPRQFLTVASLYRQRTVDKRFFRRFLSLPGRALDMPDYLLYKLSELCEFVNDIRKPFDRFYLHRISNGLYAPGARLKGMSFEQFMHADTWFAKYLQTGEDEHLNLLVASLYMRKHETFVLPPQRNFHFFRKRKRLLNIEERVKDIARLDADTRYAVFLNFVMIRTWLSKAFPFLFPVSDEDKKMKGNGKSTAWLDIFDAFVGDDIPDIDSYRALPAATAFRILNKRIRNAQTRKR